MTYPDSERLTQFIDARQRGEHPTPSDADTAFAADLMRAAQAQPDPRFVENLSARLNANPTPVNGRHGTVGRQRRPRAALTWAAVVAVALGLGVLIFRLGQPDTTRLHPAAQATTTTTLAAAAQAATATPQPTVISNPLPLLTGGYASADPTTFERMFDTGLRWTGLHLEYRADDAEAILAEAQAYFEAAREARLGVLVSLHGSADEVARAQADDFRALAEFSGHLAELGPMAIEVWPEANLDRSWPMGKINGSSYADLLRPVSGAIRAANPNVWIISGAPAPTGADAAFPDRVLNDDTFYAQMAEAGIEAHVDCIGAHYVEGVVSPLATTGDPRDAFPTRYLVSMIQRAATPFRQSTLPVCLTELGYLSPDGLSEPLDMAFAWANDTSVDEQAEWLADALTTAARLSSVRVALAMIFRVDPLPEESVINGYAIIRPDGGCPACDRIEKLQQPG